MIVPIAEEVFKVGLAEVFRSIVFGGIVRRVPSE